jgi:uncharacterized membrane protein
LLPHGLRQAAGKGFVCNLICDDPCPDLTTKQEPFGLICLAVRVGVRFGAPKDLLVLFTLETMKMKKTLITLCLVMLAILGFACSKGTSKEQVIKTAPAGNNLTVAIATKDGVLRHGNTEFTLTFTDASGKTVDVGAVALTFHMPAMGTMAEMNDAATFVTTDTAGVYRGSAKIQMAGELHAQLTYEGPAGKGKTSFPITAQ